MIIRAWDGGEVEDAKRGVGWRGNGGGGIVRASMALREKRGNRKTKG